MVEYKIAQEVHIKSLKKLYSNSFSISNYGTDYFFENKFILDNCCVCLIDKKVVAALHMIDTYIYKNLERYPVYYLYAAATLPNYRGNGYMRNLINFSNSVALKKGCLYSVLLPGTESLYKFYEKLGYKTFFKIRSITFTYEELEKFIKFESFSNNFIKNIEKIRSSYFCNDGDIFWNRDHINYAISENKIYGGKTFYTDNGYAICQVKDDMIDVIECVSDEYDIQNLLTKVLNSFKNKKYRFRLNINFNYFEKLGEIKNFGMIKDLTKKDDLNLLKENNSSYLGLALD